VQSVDGNAGCDECVMRSCYQNSNKAEQKLCVDREMKQERSFEAVKVMVPEERDSSTAREGVSGYLPHTLLKLIHN